MPLTDPRILEEGETCWRIEQAGRAAVLVDGASYFGALRQTLMKAQRSVYIVGWDIDSRVELIGERSQDDGAPTRLGDLLTHLVNQRPDLQVHLVLWDYSMVYALEREPLPSLNLAWTTPPQIKVCLDDEIPLGASHHQKIVVVDDAVAFCGGLDLTIRRWDTSEHRPDHPQRRDPKDQPYPPFHDVQMCVDGDAALTLAELVRRRWLDASCKASLDVQPTGDPWPDGLEPDFTDVDIAVARTQPMLNGTAGVQEVKALYLAAIGRAEKVIYIENQFLTADSIAEKLAQRLSENDALQVLLVSPRDHDSWLEARSMKAGRIRFMRRLQKADVADRVRLVYPVVSGDDGESPVMVHAKLMVVDDLFLQVGSSNLNNRSMGTDTECDLAIEAADDRQKQAIAGVRNRLIGEHIGASASKVAEALETEGSLFAALDALETGARRFQPVQDEGDYADPLSQTVADIADPERPVEASKFIGNMFGGQPAKRLVSRFGSLMLVGLLLVALALVWRYTPLSQLTDPEYLRPALENVASSRWTFLIVPALYVGGGLIVFPITVLIALTAVVFDPLWAVIYAGVGSLLSCIVTYQVGALAGRKLLRDFMGQRLNRISRAMASQGVLTVMAIRLVPVAPFSLINLVAGVSHIRFYDYIAGSVLGLAPGILIMTALGHRFARILEDPSVSEIAMLGVIVCVWLGMSIGLQRIVARMRSTERD